VLRPKSPGLRQIPKRSIEAPACLDPGQQRPPDGANKAPGALKIMWFISHNATEIVDFDSITGNRQKRGASNSIAKGEAFGFATRPSTSAIE
jgi:hypothetical protein